MPSYRPVNAVLRALKVLNVVNSRRQSTVSEIARASGLTSSTAVRFLETLESAGYVLKDTSNAAYVVSGKVLELSSGFEAYREMGVIAGPFLYALQREISWPSDVAVFDRDAMIVAETSRSESRLFYPRPPGFRAPIMGTSLGLAYLAFCTESELQTAVEVSAQVAEPWNDLARDRGKLQGVLARVRECGYAVMSQEYSALVYNRAIWAMAVPILLAGQAIASINVTMNREVSENEATSKYLASLQRTAARISQAIDKARHPSG
ncbi:DNA-binding transcriptional activator, 3HPP-binding [Mesorhizobium sp. SOD10]|nr:DNA-binding transcriptional activator, 3HPP-binding [Mesorhizobium sp. SOD10]